MMTNFYPEEILDMNGTPYKRPAYWEAVLQVGNGEKPRIYKGYGDTKRLAVLAAIDLMNFYEGNSRIAQENA